MGRLLLACIAAGIGILAHGRSCYGLERYGRAAADLWAVLRRLRSKG